MTAKTRAFLECTQTLTSISLKYTTIYMAIYELNGNDKLKTYKGAQKTKRNSNITVNNTSKPQGKKPKEEERRGTTKW